MTEFLASGDIRRGAEINRRVTYDAPCHLYHAQRVTAAPQRVLTSIPGLEYIELEGMQDCCGGAGIYNLSEPEMSNQLLSDKINKVKATGADVLVTVRSDNFTGSSGATKTANSCAISEVACR